MECPVQSRFRGPKLNDFFLSENLAPQILDLFEELFFQVRSRFLGKYLHDSVGIWACWKCFQRPSRLKQLLLKKFLCTSWATKSCFLWKWFHGNKSWIFSDRHYRISWVKVMYNFTLFFQRLPGKNVGFLGHSG